MDNHFTWTTQSCCWDRKTTTTMMTMRATTHTKKTMTTMDKLEKLEQRIGIGVERSIRTRNLTLFSFHIYTKSGEVNNGRHYCVYCGTYWSIKTGDILANYVL